MLDLIHLGLGPDGHTASLVPDDAVLEVRDRDVAVTAGEYQGRRRMTLTYPVLDRARAILWLIDGAAKADMLPLVQAGDASIPAGRVRNGERHGDRRSRGRRQASHLRRGAVLAYDGSPCESAIHSCRSSASISCCTSRGRTISDSSTAW